MVVIIRAPHDQSGGPVGSSAPPVCLVLALPLFQATSRCTHQRWWTPAPGGRGEVQGFLPTGWDRWNSSVQITDTSWSNLQNSQAKWQLCVLVERGTRHPPWRDTWKVSIMQTSWPKPPHHQCCNMQVSTEREVEHGTRSRLTSTKGDSIPPHLEATETAPRPTFLQQVSTAVGSAQES